MCLLWLVPPARRQPPACCLPPGWALGPQALGGWEGGNITTQGVRHVRNIVLELARPLFELGRIERLKRYSFCRSGRTPPFFSPPGRKGQKTPGHAMPKPPLFEF